MFVSKPYVYNKYIKLNEYVYSMYYNLLLIMECGRPKTQANFSLSYHNIFLYCKFVIGTS